MLGMKEEVTEPEDQQEEDLRGLNLCLPFFFFLKVEGIGGDRERNTDWLPHTGAQPEAGD